MKLKELYPTQGMITTWKQSKDDEWLAAISSDDAANLDNLLRIKYGNRRLCALGDEMQTEFNMVSDIVYIIHAEKWRKLWSGYTAEYNPLYNVDSTTSETITHDLTFTKGGTDTTVNTGSDTTTTEGTTTTDNSIFAFDSSEASPAVNDVVTPDITETLTHDTSNTLTRDLTDTDTGTIETVTTRQGNQGVTMTQQMLEADLDLWVNVKMLFYETVMRDIANYICYKIVFD